MGTDNDTKKGTLYVNGEPIAEVEEIKIPLEVGPSDFPPILKDASITFIGKWPKKLLWKLRWWCFKALVRERAAQILQKLGLKWGY